MSPSAKATHTPGWELREFAHEAAYGQPRRIFRMEIVEPRFQHGNRMASRRVCQIIDFGNYTDDMDYARLIAAAPDLHEKGKALSLQLRAIMWQLHGQAYSSTLSALNDFDAAISRAEGRADGL